MYRTVNRRPDPTSHRFRARWVWLAALWCAMVVSACAGGSGSSGFEPALVRENRAIDEALATQGCEMNEGLIICASGAEMPSASPTPTIPPALPSFTPTRTSTPEAVGTPTTTIPRPSFTATPPADTATPSPTATSIPLQPNVDTNVPLDDTLQCQLSEVADSCPFVFMFEPQGLPDAAHYNVAVRTRNPDGDWLVLPVVNNTAIIEIDTSPSGPDYQIAVLVFEEEPSFVPETVELLADTGADYAFVTPVLTTESP